MGLFLPPVSLDPEFVDKLAEHSARTTIDRLQSQIDGALSTQLRMARRMAFVQIVLGSGVAIALALGGMLFDRFQLPRAGEFLRTAGAFLLASSIAGGITVWAMAISAKLQDLVSRDGTADQTRAPLRATFDGGAESPASAAQPGKAADESQG